MQAYHQPLNGFKILGVQNRTRHSQGVNLLAGGEYIGEVLVGITLVIVNDGIAEVNGLGRVRIQTVKQFHCDLLATVLYFGHLQLRW